MDCHPNSQITSLTSQINPSLNIIQWNCRGYFDKKSELDIIVSQKKHKNNLYSRI